jgi:hypothetical protein
MPDQVAEFLSKAEDAIGTPAVSHDEPKVPFASALKLTAEQETKMIEHAFKRMQTLNNELGRDQTLDPTWWTGLSASSNLAIASQGLVVASDTFMGKRSRFDATFLNDVSWRPYTLGPDSIFNSSNLTVPLVRRICRQMIARAKNAFFGSEPWFSVDPAPVPEYDPQDDEGRAVRIEHFCRFKLHESASRDDKERSISRALILGECAVKTSYVVRDQLFNVEAEVLVGVDGQPARAQDGNYITKDDKYVDSEDGAGTRVLARDGVTPEEPIYFKDFLCPITASDVQTADFVIHLYDKPVMEFVDLVVKRGMVGDTAGGPEAARKKCSRSSSRSDNSPSRKRPSIARRSTERSLRQSPPSVETGGPVAEFMECYVVRRQRRRHRREHHAHRGPQHAGPIFYDHVANVTTDGLRPIEIVRVNPVRGSLVRQGILEMFESYQTITDLLVNRWNFSQSRAGRVDLWTPTNTLEGDRDPNLKMNWGGTYTKKPGMKKEDVLESVYLTDTKFDQVQTMIQFFLQLA